MLSTFICWAVMPLAALNKALIIVLTLFLTSDFGDILHGVAVHVSTDLSGFVERFKLPHDLYQPDGTFSWGQVRLFLVALSELRSRGLRSEEHTSELQSLRH